MDNKIKIYDCVSCSWFGKYPTIADLTNGHKTKICPICGNEIELDDLFEESQD